MVRRGEITDRAFQESSHFCQNMAKAAANGETRWRRDGTWDRFLAHAQTKKRRGRRDRVGSERGRCVIRVHQHATGARSEKSAQDASSFDSIRSAAHACRRV